MAARSPTDRDALRMKLSALLDGELPETEQNQLFDAMSQDPALLAEFEALAATRSAFAHLPQADAAALTASVMAAVDPDTTPASVAGALALASRALDGEALPQAALDAALAQAGAADAVLGFVAANELVRAGGAAVALSPDTQQALAPVAARIEASVASTERASVLASAYADAALTEGEARELDALWDRIDDASHALPVSMAAVREALHAARDSAAFVRHAKRAGDAAVQAVEALAHQAAVPTARPAQPRTEARPSLVVRLWQSFTLARLPLAFAGAAAALFFAVRTPAPVDGPPRPADDRAQLAQVMLDALAPAVLADAPPPGDLPLLADNAADVEALDAGGTTMVFSTQESNITVIWVSGDDDGEEQGT